MDSLHARRTLHRKMELIGRPVALYVRGPAVVGASTVPAHSLHYQTVVTVEHSCRLVVLQQRILRETNTIIDEFHILEFKVMAFKSLNVFYKIA